MHEEPPDIMPKGLREYWKPGDVVVQTWLNNNNPDYGYYINIVGKNCYATVRSKTDVSVSRYGGDPNRIRWATRNNIKYVVHPNKPTNPLEVY